MVGGGESWRVGAGTKVTEGKESMKNSLDVETRCAGKC